MVLVVVVCCINIGKGVFILGIFGFIKNEKLIKLFIDLVDFLFFIDLDVFKINVFLLVFV